MTQHPMKAALLCLSLLPFSLLSLRLCRAEEPNAPVQEEMRGLWVARYSLTSPQAVRNIVAAARRANLNTLFVQVRGRGDAWYLSEWEPRAEALAKQPVDYDPLALILAEAHRSGLKVHAWLNTYLLWTGDTPPKSPKHLLRAHPDWIARNNLNQYQRKATMDVEGVYLQPSHPLVQEHLYQVFTDVARRYDVDGIHFDFVRYPGASYDMSDAALARFRDYLRPQLNEDGRRLLDDTKDRLACVHHFPAEWAHWRREQVTALVRRISEAIHTMKPWVQVSAAVFANIHDAYTDKGQDWRRWLAEGYLDAVCPMAYSQDTETVARQIRQALEAAGEKHVYAGIGAWRIPAQNTEEKIARLRALGVQGITLFSYDGVTENGRSSRYLDHLRRRSFASRAVPPRMHWRAERAPSRFPTRSGEEGGERP